MEIGEPVKSSQAKPISQRQPSCQPRRLARLATAMALHRCGILYISSAGPTSDVHFITFMYVRHVFFPRDKKKNRETATLQLNGVVSIRRTIYLPFKTKHLLRLFKVLKGNHYTL